MTVAEVTTLSPASEKLRERLGESPVAARATVADRDLQGRSEADLGTFNLGNINSAFTPFTNCRKSTGLLLRPS